MGNQAVGSQAGSQSSSTQAGQSSQEQGKGSESPSFSESVFGKPGANGAAGTQTEAQNQGSQAGPGQGQRFEGMKEGETLEAFVTRTNQELARTRREAAQYRTKVRELAGDPTQDAEGLTEFQRLQRQVEGLTNDLSAERNARKSERVSTALITALAEAGAVSPNRAMRLIDVSKELEIGQDGEPTPESVGEAVRKLAAEMPTIFGDVRGNGDGGAGNHGFGGATDPNDFNAAIRARARR